MEAVKILHLEDSCSDAELVDRVLKRANFNFKKLNVDNREAFVNGLEEFSPDIVLSDHSLPSFNSIEALKIVRKHVVPTAFILVTATLDDDLAAEVIKEGADDFVLKDRLKRLPTAIHSAIKKSNYEIEKKKLEQERLLLLERYEYVTQATNEAIWDWDLGTNSVFCGKGYETLFGYDLRKHETPNYFENIYIHPHDSKRVLRGLTKVINSTKINWSDEYRYLKANGEYTFVQDKGIVLRDKTGKGIRMIGAMKDISQQKKYIQEIEEQNRKLREIAWIQSHVVRAPLARIMGLCDLIKGEDLKLIEADLLTHLLASSHELDGIIREIVSKTEQIQIN